MPRILIVDDDESLKKIYSRFLIAEGFNVIKARNGEEALLISGEKNIDVILLDIRMPIVNGLIAASALQQCYPNAKTIVFSCYSVEFQKKMVTDADGYFNKSEGCIALLSKIQSVLSPGLLQSVTKV